jgi:1,4-alpha-glucan branching enzyme
LARAGFHYSFVDSHALANASEVSPRGVYAPVVSPAGVAFFGRDWETGHQVWSAEEGYPGHPDYREFYRDLGFELPVEELAEFIIDNHIRVNTGLKYRRITSRKGEEKAFYNPAAAREQAAHDAAHFLANRQRQVTRLAGEYPGRPPLVVALYDAELFGHWWFEGPQFLDYMLRKMHYDQDTVKTLSPADYLRLYPENPASEPAGSSWGGDGTYEFWVNASNRGLVSQLQQAADRLSQIVEAPPARNTAERKRVLRQMFRELLLAQASDWPFIMRTGTSPAYAEKRVTDHLQRFWALEEMLGSELGEKAERELSLLEALDAVFPDCDPSLYIRGKIPQFS